MAPSPPSPPSAPPSSSKSGEPRYLVLLAITIVLVGAGGLITAFAIGALLSFLPSVVGAALGAVVGFGLPLFLALRASAALKRKRAALVIRRLAVLLLACGAQLAITGAILQYSNRSTGNMAYTAYSVVDVLGGIPVVSDLLLAHAERNGGLPIGEVKKKTKTIPGPDGGTIVVEVGPDGGVKTGPDGGVIAVKPEADAGVKDGPKDAGTAVEPPTTTTASTRGPAPPKPKTGVPLSPRAEGKAARTFAAGISTNTGDSLILVGTVAAGGAFTTRVVDLSSVDKLGEPGVIECAEDGTVAAILGGSHVVISKPGKTTAEPIKALDPGQKLAGVEIQSVKDVIIGPGGNGLVVVDVLTGVNGETAQELITLPKGPTPATVLRKTGDKVPNSTTDATIAKAWTFKKDSGANSVIVTETYLEGGDDVGTRMSGETWLLNPQRLLVVKLDSPKALIEIGKTGTEPSGIDGKELQNFGDAWLLADGRALFDGNFIEKGDDGWLFQVKSGGIFALAPELAPSSGGTGAAWTATPVRAKHLEAGSDGTFAFRRDDGAVVISSVDKPAEAQAALLGADALGSDGHKLGTVASADYPILARGGEWIVSSVSIKGATTHDAIVLASKADVQNGKAEVIVEVGAKVPESVGKGGKPKDRTVQSIRFGKGRDELLWQK